MNDGRMEQIDLETMEFDAEKYFPQAFHRGIREAIREGIEMGIKAHCRIPIGDQEAQQVRFFMDGVNDIGDGSIHRGLDRMMDNHREMQRMISLKDDEEHKKEEAEKARDHRAMRRLRGRLDALSGKVGATVLTALVLAVLGVFWLGLRTHLNTPPVP